MPMGQGRAQGPRAAKEKTVQPRDCTASTCPTLGIRSEALYRPIGRREISALTAMPMLPRGGERALMDAAKIGAVHPVSSPMAEAVTLWNLRLKISLRRVSVVR